MEGNSNTTTNSNAPTRQLDWAAGPGGGGSDDEVVVTDSGLRNLFCFVTPTATC